jgi:hypothetical protein
MANRKRREGEEGGGRRRRGEEEVSMPLLPAFYHTCYACYLSLLLCSLLPASSSFFLTCCLFSYLLPLLYLYLCLFTLFTFAASSLFCLSACLSMRV